MFRDSVSAIVLLKISNVLFDRQKSYFSCVDSVICCPPTLPRCNQPDFDSVSAYLDQLTVAIIGKRIQIKNIIGNMIIGPQVFDEIAPDFAVSEENSFKIINTPNFFDEYVPNLDQHIIDFMALSYPGPHLFILAIDSENTQKEKVLAQVGKLQEMFGQAITAYLVVMLPDLESYVSLLHLSNLLNIWSPGHQQLASECRRVCCGRPPFLFDFKNYSQETVMRRIAALEKKRYYLHH